jgi:hypothetical protein
MKSISLRVFAVVLLLSVLVSCSSKPKDPTEPLWGKWTYYDTEGGEEYSYVYDYEYEEFQDDIEFLSDGTVLIGDDPYLYVNALEYSLVDDNRLKFTTLGITLVVEFELDGDQLKLIFDDVSNLYQREDSEN